MRLQVERRPERPGARGLPHLGSTLDVGIPGPQGHISGLEGTYGGRLGWFLMGLEVGRGPERRGVDSPANFPRVSGCQFWVPARWGHRSRAGGPVRPGDAAPEPGEAPLSRPRGGGGAVGVVTLAPNPLDRAPIARSAVTWFHVRCLPPPPPAPPSLRASSLAPETRLRHG